VNLVAEYCQRELTDSHDKLIAISGIAKIYNESHHKGAAYLAGLWLPCLFEQLMWVGHGPGTKRSECYRAPSWSWASMDGPIYYSSYSNNSSAQLVSWNIELADENLPYGSVLSGYVEIKARMLPYPTDAQDDWGGIRVKFDDELVGMPSDTRTWLLETFPMKSRLNKGSHLLLAETGQTGEYRRIGCVHSWHVGPSYEARKAKWDRDAEWATVKII